MLSITRNPADVAGRLLIFTYSALLTGLFFYNAGTDFNGLRTRLNVIFLTTYILILLPYVYMSLYTSDKQYFLADISSRLYSHSAYYVAKQVAMLPFGILFPLAHVLLLYGMVGFRWQVEAVLVELAVCILLYLVAAQVSGFRV
jgi:hypothetical protein